MSTAEEFKAKGNAALQAGNTSEAIEFYSKAINADGSNHVYFSNRSAAYLKMGDANNALEDANSCIGLNPDFAKGYSRKGAALHALKRYNDSIAAYDEGLQKFPNDAGIKKGMDDVKREKENPMGTGGGGGAMGANSMFSPEMLAQMSLDPRMRPLLNDPQVMAKIKMVQSNPNLLPTMLQDPQMMQLLGLMMGQEGGGEDDSTPPPPTPTSTPARPEAAKTAQTTTNTTEAPAPEKEEEEDLSGLTPEERKAKEDQKAAKAKKEEGNQLYKAKKFEEALAKYDEAIALDPKTMTFLSNKAAVYFTQKKYDECIEMCLKAVEVGKEHRAPFEDRGKAYTRAAKAYQKKKDLENAIKMCQEAQLENYDKDTQRLLKTMELEKKKADALAYQSDEKAEEAKQRGNEHFRNKEWGPAVEAYEEAVKRAPKNAPIRNNLAAALCKIMDFSGAQRSIEVALELDPKYVKAWARKGDIEMYMKEYHKAMESYKKGLELDPDNKSCKEGLQKVQMQINYGRSNMTEAEKKEQAAHAMADPEIQSILQDPVMQQILKDFGENPNAAQQAMQDPTIRAKIEKLIASGIIETR
eukprot:CAMPEP_0172443494 /NCGR_PEP_ID=MMETSP1065-20121228/3741_1 /TAXON_ID=265537 /ORGANISM="Amphiprora paludosa, Strain CCMP125" /LENGTH=582 /DNA_ID=CAMNT_0013193751 /DNA_START=60 /DNA_END=1808 /DNA_ORIENTATION=-